MGALADLQPGWTSLWSLKDHLDDRLLLQRYWETMKVKVLPALNRTTAYQPLLEITQKKFAEAGYELKPIEATFMAKLLTLILEYAAPSQATHGSHGHLAAGIYNILPLLDKERLASDEPITLPRWVSTLLRTIVKDERAVKFPVQAVVHFAYNDLLSDAATHAFNMIETATGEDLGDEAEQAEYIAQTVQMLAKEAPLDFSRVYMPLVLGGVIVYDRVMMQDEKLGELLEDMRDILNAKIKLREKFRPFAPSILEEAVAEYFVTDHPDPFMIHVYPVRTDKRAVIPAVTHVDGSGRLQTVSAATDPLYWQLLAAFRERTGVPVLLNTSFNENEPIVHRPEEALDCFLRTQMDVLVMGHYVVEKAEGVKCKA